MPTVVYTSLSVSENQSRCVSQAVFYSVFQNVWGDSDVLLIVISKRIIKHKERECYENKKLIVLMMLLTSIISSFVISASAKIIKM